MPSFHKALFNNNYKSVSDNYGKYLDKILEVIGGKVVYGYEELNKR